MLTFCRQITTVFKMSTFVSRVSPVTGKIEWIVQNDNYDYHQEVARSSYADMLHDTERNQKYELALSAAIDTMHRRGKKARVLDIGTGSGLLSMMAARSGADVITACEAFKPMADCARQIIQDNGFEAKIKLIPKRSTEVTVGSGGDMAERANILVTEVFDTELIGEGAIGTFNHAHKCLLEDDCIVVPSAANVYIQVVSSRFFKRWNTFESISLPNGELVVPPAEVSTCPGTAAVHDLQLGVATYDLFEPITEPTCVFSFDFCHKKSIELEEYKEVVVQALQGGHCDVLFMWWDLQMDMLSEVMLSTAPWWAHPTPNSIQWRDHWMQAVYYPVSQIDLKKSDRFKVHCFHDEYSMWFELNDIDNGPKSNMMPLCVCGAHIACSRTRVGMLNDKSRNSCFAEALLKVVDEDSVCLCISDESLLPIIAAKLGASKVYTIQTNPLSHKFLDAYIQSNKLEECVQVVNKSLEELTSEDFDGKKVNLLLGEPFFQTSVLPWDNIYYLYARSELSSLLSDDCIVMPAFASIKAIAVEFKDLHKIRAPVGNCEGLCLDALDKLVMAASDIADGYVEPHPLWEYPAIPLTEDFDILQLNFTTSLEGIKMLERDGTIEFCSSGTCNGVAVWMDYSLDNSRTISTGLMSPPVEGKELRWYPFSKQGVHFFKQPEIVDLTDEQRRWKLRHKVTFRPKTGEIELQFVVTSEN